MNFEKVVDEGMEQAVLQHLQESFFPDEPVFRWLSDCVHLELS